MKNKTGIFIVTYNVPELLLRQVQCIRKFCTDTDYDIMVVDNSSEKEAATAIQYHSGMLRCFYMRTQSSSKGGSESHAFACNMSYQMHGKKYARVLYLDHDNFPIRQFNVEELLKDKVMAGVGQQKSKLYMWPGLIAINNTQIDTSVVDFSCSLPHGLDTGGMLFSIIEKHKDRCIFFDESYVENPHFTKPPYNYYSLLAGGTFMHFVASSNWRKLDDNTDRVNSLLNILEGYYNA